MSDMHEEIIPTAYGKFAVDMLRDKKMGTKLKSNPYPQEETIQVLKKIITEESVVVDVGAHIGTLAVPLAKLVKKVIAFEMDPDTFAFLRKNIDLNNVSLDARNIALGEKKGFGSSSAPQSSNAGANTFVMGSGGLPSSTLNDEVDFTDVIKIDVEGMELSVLRGASELIERSRPFVLFEVNLPSMRSHHVQLAALATFFRSRKYHLYISEGGFLGKVSLNLAALILAPRALLGGEAGPFDLLAIPEEKSAAMLPTSFAQGIPLLWRHRRVRQR